MGGAVIEVKRPKQFRWTVSFLRVHSSTFRCSVGFLPAVSPHPLSDRRPQLASCFSLTNGNFTVLHQSDVFTSFSLLTTVPELPVWLQQRCRSPTGVLLDFSTGSTPIIPLQHALGKDSAPSVQWQKILSPFHTCRLSLKRWGTFPAWGHGRMGAGIDTGRNLFRQFATSRGSDILGENGRAVLSMRPVTWQGQTQTHTCPTEGTFTRRELANRKTSQLLASSTASTL